MQYRNIHSILWKVLNTPVNKKLRHWSSPPAALPVTKKPKNMTEPANSEATTPLSNEIDQHWRIVRQQLQAYACASNDLPIPDTTAEGGSTTAQVFEFPTSSLLELIRKAQYENSYFNVNNVTNTTPNSPSLMTKTKMSESQRQLIPNKTSAPFGLDPLQLISEEQRLENISIEERTLKLQEELSYHLNDEEMRKKLIELKSLKLIPKQRMLREMVLRFIRKTNILDSERSNQRRSKKQSLREARLLERLEKQQKIDRTRKERQSYYEYLNTVLNRGKEFATNHKILQQRVAKLTKSVMHHHSVYEKEEQKRIEKLSKDRIKALRADDEEAYLKLIDQEKDTRLTHLLRQTDEFLKGLTAKVVAQQSKSMSTTASTATTVSASTSNATISSNFVPSTSTTTESTTPEDEIIADYYETAHRIKEEIREQPIILNGGKLKDYQLKGLQWMNSLYNNHLNGILADEMGLGKTIQTISLISHLMERKGQNGPFLVIVPLSTMTNWGLEFEKWAPSIIKVEYKGVPNQRKLVQQQIKHGKFNVMLTTYEYIIKDRSFLSKIKWLYMIIDEGHRMKNSHSKLTLVLTQHYSARFRLILTGTPLQNNLPELWALLNFILPHIFNSSKTFDEWFNAPFANTGEKVELNEEETLLIIRRLHKVLRPFLLRRLKKDVESELPDKVEKIIKCPMSALQQRLYSMITQRNRLSFQSTEIDANRKTVAIRRLNNTVMQLRKICNHPFVFEEVERQINPGSINNENLFRVSGKFELLQRILSKFQKTGHRVLIFFQMTQIMTIFEDFLIMQGYKYLRLDGSTKAEDRSDLLKKFNQPESPYFIFMLSTRAGGLGLNLQTADTVIIFDSDWNPHQDLQAQDRAHRIGQTKEVRIFRLITVDSVEEYILERAQFKLNLDGKVIQAGKFDQKSTNEEREAMLKAIFEGEQEKNDVDEVYSDDELNEIIARNDEELEIFRSEDETRQRMESQLGRSRLIEASELPKVYVALDDEEEAALAAEEEERREDEFMRRSRAKQEAIKEYNENISDDKWLEQLEESAADASDDFTVEPIKRKQFSNPNSEDGQKRKRGRPPVKKQSQSQTVSFTPSLHLTKSLPQPLLETLSDRIHDLIENKTDEDGRYLCDIYLELPSREDYPDYYQMISKPLSLNQVAERIDSRQYTSLADLISDYDQIWMNAMTYNVEGSMVYEDALLLKQLVHDTVDTFIEEHNQELSN